ncbi:MAG: Ig-like domain-containing protein [Gemmatimonadetes bacterium]|nr:Ig-like domain-containing protein [Gemmatimonadota bacterium]
MATTHDPTNALTHHISAESRDQLKDTLTKATAGEYEILTELGRGGMAVVYLANDLTLDRKVAIKVMSPELLLMGHEVVERFNREARTSAKLSHPHIIPIYTVKSSDDLNYFVMKFIRGRSLESVMRGEERLPIGVVQTILGQIAGALDYADRNGVIHRDIKPGNIMLDEEGWAVVMDFGIAKAVDSDALTMTGAALGTPSYMSPEQCAGLPLTGAADQYSLGVLAYEMLSGKLPFEGDSAMTVMYLHTHEPPPPITDAWPECPPDLATALMRMLEKKPENRWPSMASAAAAIAAVQNVNDTAIRTQMVGMVKRASNQSLLAQFHTPRTPLPSGGSRSVSAASSAVTPDTSPIASGLYAARAGKRRSLAWLIGVPIVGAVAAAGWFLRPDGTPGAAEPATAASPVMTQTAAPAVASLELVPGVATLTVGETRQLTATPRDSSGDQLADTDVTWNSNDDNIARVSPGGTVTAVAAGFAQITARAAGHSSTVGVTVNAPRPVSRPVETAPAVASVRVTPTSPSVVVGGSVRLQATALDSRGNTLGPQTTMWRTSNGGVVTIGSDGLATGVQTGTAQITATVDEHSATTTITVTAVPVASIRLTPTNQTMQQGETTQLTAVTLDANGAQLSGRTVSWSTSSNVARVSSSGRVTSVSTGTVTVTATSESRSATATIIVTARPTPEPTPQPDPALDRREIGAALDRYASALESRDLDQLRRAYPGLTQQQENAWRTFFDNVESLNVTLDITSIDISGDTATADVDAAQAYRAGRQLSQRSSFRATLERAATGWRITRIQ